MNLFFDYSLKNDMVYPNYFSFFSMHLCIINLRLGPRSSISSASSSRIFPPLFCTFCKQTSLFSPSASSPHIFLHNFSFLSKILHLLFSFLPQPTSCLFPSLLLLFDFLNLSLAVLFSREHSRYICYRRPLC